MRNTDELRQLQKLDLLEKKVSVGLNNMDAYINVIGGMKADEPALDRADRGVAGERRER